MWPVAYFLTFCYNIYSEKSLIIQCSNSFRVERRGIMHWQFWNQTENNPQPCTCKHFWLWYQYRWTNSKSKGWPLALDLFCISAYLCLVGHKAAIAGPSPLKPLFLLPFISVAVNQFFGELKQVASCDSKGTLQVGEAWSNIQAVVERQKASRKYAMK